MKEGSAVRWYPKLELDETATTPEEVSKLFSPEEVCLQESCNSAEYRLRKQFISEVDIGKVEAWLTLMYRMKQFKMERAEKAKKLANEYSWDHSPESRELLQSAEKLVKVLVKDIQRLDNKMAIGRFIFDR